MNTYNCPDSSWLVTEKVATLMNTNWGKEEEKKHENERKSKEG